MALAPNRNWWIFPLKACIFSILNDLKQEREREDGNLLTSAS